MNKKLSKKALADEFSARLKKIYPTAECALEYEGDPWRLLVMARLSAQCTDKRVNEVSRKLFLEIPTPQDAANISQERLEELIRSCGLFRTKAQLRYKIPQTPLSPLVAVEPQSCRRGLVSYRASGLPSS